MADKTNKLSICLLKADIQAFSDAVVPGARPHEIEDVGVFYGADSFVRPPEWVSDFFGHSLDGVFDFRTASSRGVLLVQVEHEQGPRIFATLFGHGRHLLADGVIEDRFGLKTVLNTVERGSLRGIEKTTLGAPAKQSREQMSREGEATLFGIDIEQDLLNAVTGRSKDVRLGKVLSGRDGLAVSVKVDLAEIKTFLTICLDAYLSDAYKADFDWIDQIKDVRDPQKVSELNNWLIDRLVARDLDRVWMIPPAILDWVDVKGFRYGGKKRPELRTDLDVAEFLDSVGDAEITVDMLKSRGVNAISSRTDDLIEHWSAFNCLYAEATIDGRMFILNHGKWFEIAGDFTAKVIKEFAEMPESEIQAIDYEHENESEYNVALSAALDGSCCLDANLISHGGGHSTIEFCDVLTADNKLVHVKRYSGSAQLSHLFNQGAVSGELFVQASDFREKLNEKLPDAHKLPNPAERPMASEYEVVYGIITPPGKPLDIPFFSKVTLRNARRRLEAYGFTVSKMQIESTSG